MKKFLKVLGIVLLYAVAIVGIISEETEQLNTIRLIIGSMISFILIIVGIFLIYRAFKSYASKHEIRNNCIKEIRKQWLEYGEPEEPPIDYVYDCACEYERCRIYTKLGLLTVGILTIVLGIGTMINIL